MLSGLGVDDGVCGDGEREPRGERVGLAGQRQKAHRLEVNSIGNLARTFASLFKILD